MVVRLRLRSPSPVITGGVIGRFGYQCYHKYICTHYDWQFTDNWKTQSRSNYRIPPPSARARLTRRLATHRSQWKGFLSRHECIPGMWPYIRVTIPEFSRVLFIVTISPRDAASFRNNRRVRGTKTEIFATITGTMREKGPSFYVNNHSQKRRNIPRGGWQQGLIDHCWLF